MICYKVNGARKYIFRRILAFILIRNSVLRSLYFSFFSFFRNVDVDDAEQIFIALETERELENVWLINQMTKFLDFKYYVDVGCNYSQFASSLHMPYANATLCDINSDAIAYSETIEYKFKNVNFVRTAVVPSNYESNTVKTLINKQNSGLSTILCGDSIQSDFCNIETATATKITCLINPDSDELCLFKIDIEGNEALLAENILNSSIDSNNIVVCCEVLNRISLNEFKILEKFSNRVFVYVKYRDYSPTGLMYKSPIQVLRALVFGDLYFEIVVSDKVDEIGQNFIPLLFSIPKKLMERVSFGSFESPTFPLRQ